MKSKTNKKENETSWGKVAPWYDNLLKTDNTYQKDVILPNLLKIMEIKKEENILDLACGQGFFTREYAKISSNVLGADISPELIKIAQDSSSNIKYISTPANNLSQMGDKSIDKISIILAIQNIEDLNGTIKECSRIIKSGGKFYIVLNHPSFRVPKKSSWEYDNKSQIQYRRVERYMSEIMTKIDMNPGESDYKNKKYTISFHRPLHKYFDIFNKNNFAVSRLEEWISNKKSQIGPKQKAEDIARKEIPMFMCLELVKLK